MGTRTDTEVPWHTQINIEDTDRSLKKQSNLYIMCVRETKEEVPKRRRRGERRKKEEEEE